MPRGGAGRGGGGLQAGNVWSILTTVEKELEMDVRPGDIITVKKQHPCGSSEFSVLRIGMDFKIKCLGCQREIMLPRSKIEKNIKLINGEKVRRGNV